MRRMRRPSPSAGIHGIGKRGTQRPKPPPSDILAKGDTFILVDDGLLYQDERLADYSVPPFLEKDGTYYGAPTDDATAIDALERARSSGACLIVFAWSAFWWLSHYADFSRHIRTNFRCLVETECLTIFDLRP